MTTSIPLDILHNSVEQQVTVHLQTGDQFSGRLTGVTDNMNIEIRETTHTDKKGAKRNVNTAIVRGAQVVYFELPAAAIETAALALGNAGKKKDGRVGAKKRTRE